MKRKPLRPIKIFEIPGGPDIDIVVGSRAQVKGALPNGSRMAKDHSEHDDSHLDGDMCTVIGSIEHGGKIGYFVEWDDSPGIPVFVVPWKLRKP